MLPKKASSRPIFTKIFGKRWAIRWVAKLRFRAWGLCWLDERLIEIQAGQNVNQELGTLIHEVLHALDPHKTEPWILEAEGVLVDVILKRMDIKRKGG